MVCLSACAAAPRARARGQVLVVGDVAGDEAAGEGVAAAQPVDDLDVAPGALHDLAVLAHGDRAEADGAAGLAPLAGEDRHRHAEARRGPR